MTLPATTRVRYSFIKILVGSDLAGRRLPLMSARSANPGPVVWLTGCCHGDEVCGAVIIQEIFRRIKKRLLRGELHAFPLMNPVGFETATREISLSNEDLNRCFPGDSKGSLGQRIADRIFTTIMATSPHLLIDLHTDWTQSMPYTILDRKLDGAGNNAYQTAKTLATQTGFICIQENDDLTNTLSYNMLARGVPAFTLELGEPYVINEENVRYGVDAVVNILAAMEMFAPNPEPAAFPWPAYDGSRLYQYSDRPYSSKSGIIRFLAKPGDRIKQGQPFARIVNTFGKHQETLKANADAVVLGHSDNSVVFPGMPVMAFALS